MVILFAWIIDRITFPPTVESTPSIESGFQHKAKKEWDNEGKSGVW